jgi:hypothetical protein
MARNSSADVMHLVADALEGPCQVDPGFRWIVITIYIGGNPLSVESSHRLHSPCLIDVTFASLSPSRAAEGLITNKAHWNNGESRPG